MNFKVGQKIVSLVTESHVIGVAIKEGEIYTCGGYDKTYKGQIKILELGVHPPSGNIYCAPESWFRSLELDYAFVEEVIKQVQPETVEI